MYSFSVIVVCRFYLTLQESDQQAQSNTPSLPFIITSVNDAAEGLQDAIVEEFGERHLYPFLGASTSEEEIEAQQNPEPTTDAGIDLHEFPLARGDIGDIEAAGLGAAGKLRLLYACRLKNNAGPVITEA